MRYKQKTIQIHRTKIFNLKTASQNSIYKILKNAFAFCFQQVENTQVKNYDKICKTQTKKILDLS